MDSCITMNVYLHDLYWTYMRIAQHLAHEYTSNPCLRILYWAILNRNLHACEPRIFTGHHYSTVSAKEALQCAENTIYQIHRGDNKWCHISETCPSATQQRCTLALQHNSRKIRGEDINLQNWHVGKFNQKRRVRCYLTHCGRVTQICVFNTVKLGTSASSP